VKVIDAFIIDGSVYILIQDVETNKKRIIDQSLELPTNTFTWFLIDVDFLHRTLKRYETQVAMLADEQKLLEFDF